MSNIELIKTLNKRTGAGLMACKVALVKNDNDLDKAGDWLRKEGLVKLVNKSDRVASEGVCVVMSNDKKTVLVEVNCETDFVARCVEFNNYVSKIVKVLLNDGSQDEIDKIVTDAYVQLRERILVRRTKVIDHQDGQYVFNYTHLNSKIVTSVTLDTNDATLGKQIAMQVAASKPLYISESDVSQDELNREYEIQKSITLNQGKVKPEMVDKIVGNRVKAHFNELSLLSQPFLFDSSKTVEQILKNCKVLQFTRFQVGEN